MSIETEDAFEEALRSDLPSPDAEARLRRRLVGAGIALGNGIAATTASASGGASAASGGVGVVAKLVGASWGVKLGLAAAVAIPSVGLWLERGDGAVAATPSVVVPTAAPSAVAATPSAVAELPAAVVAPAATVSAPVSAPRAVKPPTVEVAPATREALPSQIAFAASPEPRPAQAGSTLGEETRLLDRALSALGAGDRKRAAELLAEHESRYPQGLLVKERERAKARLSELSRGE
jgi:hypothetical protein